ncbi:hypothetical protein [Nocardioides sp.]|uniref:hypothetical protein n=1 Tax=Nocardioides sp. TaxID=35761 RepID=UPI00271997D3|nr:hypothetical protein [Nocardioides sp.]MDO9457503.1 hypothetical protein [Nocardioides sp.]
MTPADDVPTARQRRRHGMLRGLLLTAAAVPFYVLAAYLRGRADDPWPTVVAVPGHVLLALGVLVMLWHAVVPLVRFGLHAGRD